MANLFFSGEKATKEEARLALMEYIADNWTDRFTADFWSDGGGHMIRAVLEFDDTNEVMSDELRAKFPAKFMGWRMVVLKVPRGHIDVFFDDKK
jgi:hypothetical protein|tara:strand:- start:924 stop:1205 length:282 start_codon:yes stop_codon:yes gene_type:complete